MILSAVLPTNSGASNSTSSIRESANTAQLSAQANLLGTPTLDIANYTFTIANIANIPSTQKYTMDGIQYVSTQPFSKAGTAFSTGSSDTPAVVFVGFSKGDYRPIMILYGSITLSSGAGLDNNVTFSNGLYTCSSTLLTSGELDIKGGVAVQLSGGSYYTDFLTNSGQKFNVSSVALGVVTVPDTSSLLAGQAIQFSGLQNPLNVNNSQLYYIDSITSPTTFTFDDVNGNLISNANANGGTVQASNTNSGPEDDYNWGMIITNGASMPLYQPAKLQNTNATAGFIATRMLLTRDTGGAQVPRLQFEGVMSLGYKGSSFSAGLGGSSADHSQTLNIDADGNVQLLNSKSGLNTVVFTANFGGSQPQSVVTSVSSGVVDAPSNTVQVGDYIRFTTLQLPIDSTASNDIKLNYPYLVTVADTAVFSIDDPNDSLAILTAQGGTYVKDIVATSINAGVVTTPNANSFKVGDPVAFTGLVNPTGIVDGQVYYVGGIDNANQFWIKQSPSDDWNYTGANASSARVYSAPFAVGGLTLGGDFNITAQFNGLYQGGTFSAPSVFQVTIDGDLSIGYSKPGFPTITGSMSLNANSGQTTGITFTVEDGDFHLLNWGGTVNAMVDVKDKVVIALSGVTAFGYSLPNDIDQFAFSGSVSATIVPWGKQVTITLGHGTTNGLTIQRDADGTTFLSQMSFLATITDLKPNSTNTNVVVADGASGPKIMSATIQVDYTGTDPESGTPKEFSLAVGGNVVLAVGKQMDDGNGNWSSTISTITVALTPDIAVLDENGVHFDFDNVPSGKIEVDLNGAFNVGPLKFTAQDLRFVVEKGQPEDPNSDVTILVSGSVSFPQLRNASVSLGTDGTSGGLYIDVQTGAWKLNGWRVQIPSIQAGPLVIQNLIIGFTGSGNSPTPDDATSWQIEAAGTFGLFAGGGMKLGVELKLGEKDNQFAVTEIGVQLRGLNPGLPIPATEGFLTDIGFQIDNIPTNVTADILIGAVFGEKINVGAKEYSLVQILLNGQYNPPDITVTGTILVGGGILGTVTGTFDANWGKDTYTLDMEGKFFYGAVDATIKLSFTPDLDYAMATIGLQVPPSIPIVGGLSLLNASFLWYDNHDTGQTFIVAWFTLLGKWKYGVEFNLNDGGHASLVGSKTINQLTSLIPGDLSGYKYSYSERYAPTAPTNQQALAMSLGDGASLDSYGIFNLTWDNPTNSDIVHINVGDGSQKSVTIYGSGATDIGTWIDIPDGNGVVNGVQQGVSLEVLPGSVAGNLLVHVNPMGAFPQDGNGKVTDRTNPDLFVPFQTSQDLNFILQSNYKQDLDPDNMDWAGNFYGPAAQITDGSLSVSQGTSETALDTYSATATANPVTADATQINFSWKTIDPNSTVNLYYSYDPTGANSQLITTLSAAELGLTTSNLGQTLNYTYSDWDLNGLEPAIPIYVFATIQDSTHVPTQTFAPQMVQSVPATSIQVGYVAQGTTNISFTTNGVSNGVVGATSDVSMLKPGDELVFDSISNATGIKIGQSYWIISVDSATSTITYSDTYGGPQDTGSSAGVGTFHVNHVTQIPVTVGATDLDGIPLQVTPVSKAVVSSVTNGVVTVDSVAALSAGARFMFGDAAGMSGISLNTPYYVIAVNTVSNSFTFSANQGGTVITSASATAGDVYVDAGDTVFYATNASGLVAPHTDVGQYYRFVMTPIRAAYDPAPGTGQGSDNLNELVEYAVFTGNNNLLRMTFNFQVQAVVAGVVSNDLDVNGVLNSKDPGLAGATVYLDDNNNGQLDPGEPSQITGTDGVYAFLHNFLDSDPLSTTYTTHVRIIPPTSTKVTGLPTQPDGGISFTKGNIAGDPSYYNFLIAEPVTIGGIVYNDANGNGSRDPGEKGLAGVTVIVTPPSGGAQTVVTDATGAWQVTSYARGAWNIAVQTPTGATVTTPSSVSISDGGNVGFNFQNNQNFPFAADDVVSEYNSATGGYQAWYPAVSLDPNNVYSEYQFNDISNISNAIPATSVNYKYVDGSAATHPLQSFLGIWQSDGTPTLATSYFNPDVTYTETHTYLMLVPNTTIQSDSNGELWHAATADPGELFALSYNPAQLNYSTVMSVDTDGKIWTWNYSPSTLGQVTDSLARNANVFTLPSGVTAVDVAGLNLTGTNHYQSQDLAIIVSDNTTGQYSLLIWNHTTNKIESTTAIPGAQLVTLLPGNFDGNGREDVAVLTVDSLTHRYYLNVLTTEADGSHALLPYSGVSLFNEQLNNQITYANLAAVRVNGAQEALVWSTVNTFYDTYLNAAVIQGGQLVVSSARVQAGGKIFAISAGSLGTAATLGIIAPPPFESAAMVLYFESITLTANGQLTVAPELISNGASFGGFDIGLTGVTPAASNTTSGIVFNDANSNGIQDPGEPGLPGYVVRITEPDGTDAIVTTSDGSDGNPVGSYTFAGVQNGATIQVILPTNGWLAQNPPPGVATSVRDAGQLNLQITFTGGTQLGVIPATGIDNDQTVAVTSGNFQSIGKENLIIRTSDTLYVQRYTEAGGVVFDQYAVSSSRGYFTPKVDLADLNGDGRLDIVASGATSVDVYLNIGLGEFVPYLNMLGSTLTGTQYAFTGTMLGDADSGISLAKRYQLALDFAGTQPVSVNGVAFTQADAGNGTDYNVEALDPITLAASPISSATGFSNQVTGSLNSALSNYMYASTGLMQLTLGGLTPGATYITTFYGASFGSTLSSQTIVDSLGGTITVDQNYAGAGNGMRFQRTFAAPSNGTMVFQIQSNDPANPFRLYALTNEQGSVGYSQVTALNNDFDIDLNDNDHFVQALDFNGTASNIVGVPFTGAGLSGSNWNLQSYVPSTGETGAAFTAYNNEPTNVQGEMSAPVTNFFAEYVGGAKLTLSGLTPGATYRTEFYGMGWADGDRIATITDTEGGSTIVNENQFGSENGFQFSRTFVASGTSITFTFVDADVNNPFHFYALSNALVSTGNYSISELAGDNNSGISTSTTYTHALDFEATQTVTVNGVTFTGAAREGDNFAVTAYDPATTDESEIEYFLNFNNDVGGNINNAISNGYVSQTGVTKVVLSGLTPGTTYTTTFYGAANGSPNGREQTIADSAGGSFHFDENEFANQASSGFRVTRTYTASSNSITFFIYADDASAPFMLSALTNEVSAVQPAPPTNYGVTFAVVPGSNGNADTVLVAEQGTGRLYQIGSLRNNPAVTGKIYETDRSIIQMQSADINADGDLIIYENVNTDGTAPAPNSAQIQRIVLLSAASNYTSGQTIIDLGNGIFNSNVLLQVGQIFSGTPSVVALAYDSTTSQSTLYTYRPTNGLLSTTIGGNFNSLTLGNLTGGSGTPDVILSQRNGITVYAPVVSAPTTDQPQGYDPTQPLQFVHQQFFQSTDFAALAPVNLDGPEQDILGVVYDSSGQFEVQRINNAYLAHMPGSDAAGALYDFAVVLPGSLGGTISGQVYYDINKSGSWDPGDYGVYNGVTVYLDLNNNGVLDPTEPSTTPDSQGRYSFPQLAAQSYPVRVLLASGYTLTTPTSQVVTLQNLPLVHVNGVDFGVHSGDVGSDLNGDGKPDLLLTDPSDNSIYVQLRDGLNRLATYKIGTLPSAEWAVVGIYDLTGDGTADVLIENLKTGQLKTWDFRPTPGIPSMEKAVDLDYRVPAGFSILGVADIDNDGKPELIVGNKSTGEHRIVNLDVALTLTSEQPLTLPDSTEVIGVGDIDRDGDADLLLRDRKTGHLLVDVYQNGASSRIVDLGMPKAGWEFAGIIDLIAGGPREILFQDKSTGDAYIWTLNADLTVASTIPVDIGANEGLRLHLAEDLAPTVSISPVDATKPVNSITLTFSEKVAGFDLSDLSLTRNGGVNLLPGSGATLTSSDGGMTWALGNLSLLTGSSGSYTLTLNAIASNIVNSAGTPLAVGASTAFQVAASPLSIFASSVTVTGTNVQLTAVHGNVDSSTIYTWSVTNKPKGASNPMFSANGSTVAQSVNALFSHVGSYTFKVVAVTNGVKQTANIVIDVAQTVATISISPSSATVYAKETQQFSAAIVDQFGAAVSGQTVVWSIDAGGEGKINKSGLFTAPKDTGSATVRATIGSSSAAALVTIAPAPLPLGISTSVSEVTGTTLQLSALNGRVNSTTIYTWSVITKPPGAKTPKFDINQSTSASSVTATFFQAGFYVIKLTTITGSRTESAAITMNVAQTSTQIKISPANVTIFEKVKQQFVATTLDQFGNSITAQPKFSWSVVGAGSIGKSGLYTAPATAGSARVTAAAEGLSMVALVQVVAMSKQAVHQFTVQDATAHAEVSRAQSRETSAAWSTAPVEPRSTEPTLFVTTVPGQPIQDSRTSKKTLLPHGDYLQRTSATGNEVFSAEVLTAAAANAAETKK